MGQRSRDLQRRIHEALPERQAFYDRYVDVLTEIHDYEMEQPAPVQRLAEITPAFGPAIDCGAPHRTASEGGHLDD